MSSGALMWISALLCSAGVALVTVTPLPGWAHWAGCGLCGLAIYATWRRP